MNSQRRAVVRELLQSKPFVSLQELEQRFPNVSSMTLRRDIEYFESLGEAIKVRGGARSMRFITNAVEDTFNLRMNENIAAKEKIARKAIELIETGRSLFLDSGTTMLRLAALIPDERLVITTTGPNIALEIIKKSQPIVNIVGGVVNRDNVSISGNQAVRFLSDMNIDIAFIVPSGVSAQNGLTSGNFIESEFKRLVIEKARRVVVLIDFSKLNKTLPYTFGNFEDIDTIIAESALSGELAEMAAKNDVEMIIAE